MEHTQGTPNLNKALAEVMGKIGSVAGTKIAYGQGKGQVKYDAVRAEDVYARVQELFAEHGVATFPSVEFMPKSDGCPVTVRISLTLAHTSGEEKTIVSTAPIDSAGSLQKATQGAATIGLKFMYRRLLNIPMADDEDETNPRSQYHRPDERKASLKPTAKGEPRPEQKTETAPKGATIKTAETSAELRGRVMAQLKKIGEHRSKHDLPASAFIESLPEPIEDLIEGNTIHWGKITEDKADELIAHCIAWRKS